MAEILAVKKQSDGKFLAHLSLDEKEHLRLQGHTSDIIIFSDKTSFVSTNMSQRGKNEATKYFLIPRQMRKGLVFNRKVSCQRIDKDNLVLFVYVIDKSINPF